MDHPTKEATGARDGSVSPPFQAVPHVEGARWALVEIFGHRQHIGRVTEVDRFGSRMCRVEVYCRDGHLVAVHEYGGAAIFAITDLPGGEERARRRVGIEGCLLPEHEAERAAAARGPYAIASSGSRFDDALEGDR